ncbi:MAG: 3-deoxy-manno-octulosonate cytidylyltransferase [Gammaproteobacteria bacterium]|nr:3-deoxy-manno-octulosonate cytidylyltransferase [Gammaproteobacteria bacterium]MDD9896079.1 3-deoxy-manno-octulosonate cytidylyltransferase [Gammaproteobacteria bacterium]MDD9957783.1 3-deoxy-manno-octulosonate cytidylyltransferase [Gammaproteobacteria bacterium]
MGFTVIIPARYGAQRLPGKPLLDIAGKPMLQHTYERARASDAKEVCIATDDKRIKEVAESFDAKVFMTSDQHRSGTDRIQEVARQLGLDSDEMVVNVQADEPLIPPAAINQVAANLMQRSEAGIATLCEVISNQEEVEDPNAVKVVVDAEGFALYFSRSTIPYQASASAQNCYRHVGIYAYRVAVLNQFVHWPPAELEISEKLEQLRALFNGIKVHVEAGAVQIPAGVDTEKDLEAVRALLSG